MGLFKKPKKRDTVLEENNFIEDKRIKFTMDPLLVGDEFLVDGANKRFACYRKRSFKMHEPEDFCFFDFEDLSGFELQEDGHMISEGSAGKALLGGLLFGAAGAVVGASGKKMTEKVCTEMIIRIKLNDLQKPTFSYKLIGKEVKKDSFAYKEAKEKAEEFLATLAFIENNK